MFLARFLYRNMKAYRFLAMLAILVAITQVSCDILALQSLKWRSSRMTSSPDAGTPRAVSRTCVVIMNAHPSVSRDEAR